MKKIAFVLGLSVAATTASAGGYADPVVEAPVVAEAAMQDSKPSAELVLALTTLVVFSAALSN